MAKKKRPIYAPEFKLETAQLVVDNGYTHEEEAKAMSVAYSTISKWVKQLKEERAGKATKASPMTPEQIEIRELKKRIERIELEKEILKKATVDSIGQRNTHMKILSSGGKLNETLICQTRKRICF